MPLHFTKANQKDLLDIAAQATSSLGWRGDAVAIGAYDQDRPGDIRAVAVFQNIDAYGAEFHFAMMPGHRLGPDVVRGFSMIALHPRGLGLESARAFIPDENIPAQVAALKCGFAFEYRVRGGAAGRKDAIVMSIHRREAVANEAPAKPQDAAPDDRAE